MTSKFLLHKDKKENKKNATAQMAHLALPNTLAILSAKSEEQFFSQRISIYNTFTITK